MSNDLTRGPSHYTNLSFQPVELNRAVLTREQYEGWLIGCLNKYSVRQGRKEGSDDGEKARWFRDELERVRAAGGDWRDVA